MKLADYSDRVTADQLDTALRQGGFEGVFHYLSGNNALRIELPDVVTPIRQRGWSQAGIDVPTLSTVDGQAAARAATAYGFGAGFRLYLDIEPDEFNLNPAPWAQAANAWCDGVHAASFSPGIYGTDATVAACANNADTIWRAKPGMCDPAGAGLDPVFFAGRRAVQCGQETWNGVSFDVSYSQFPLGGDMTDLEHAWLQHLTEQYDNYLHPLLTNPGGLLDQFTALQAKVAALSTPTVDVKALATALAPLLPPQTDPNVIATAVLQHLSKDTAAG